MLYYLPRGTMVLCLSVAALSLSANAEADDKAPVQTTGQTQCYDATGTITACVNSGQDGDQHKGVSGSEPRFVQANGIVTDTWTGLEWLQNADCIRTEYPQFDQFAALGDGSITWQQGLDFIKGINNNTYAGCSAGHSDWRLPNIRELQSLVDFGVGEPAIANGASFTNLASNLYWSSSTMEESTSGQTPTTWRAWSVNMKTGAAWADDKAGSGYVFSYPGGHVLPVRNQTKGALAVAQTGQKTCYDPDGKAIVCAGTGQDGELQAGIKPTSPRFKIGVGTVTDNLTNLTWMQNADCIRTEYPEYDQHATAGDGVVTWQQALDFVAGLNNGTYAKCAAGQNKWRLPNIREVQSLIDFGLGIPAIPNTSGQGKWAAGDPFNNLMNTLYWSSTSDAHDPANTASHAWAVGLRSGATWADVKNGSGSAMGFPMGRVWPVLDAGSSTVTATPDTGTVTTTSDTGTTGTSSGNGGGGSFDFAFLALLPLMGLLGGRFRKK